MKSDGNLGQQDPVLAGNANFKTSYQTLALVSQIDLPSGLSNRLALGQNKERNETGVGTAVRANVETTTYYLREELRVPIGTRHEALFGGSLARGSSTIDLSGRNARCTEFDPNCDFTSAPLVQTQQTIRANFADAYVNDRYRFLPNWVGIAGLRYSYDNYLRQSYVDPRVGLEWEWSPNTLLSAAWGYYNQFPDREQVIRDWGNPALPRQLARRRNPDPARADFAGLGLSVPDLVEIRAHQRSDRPDLPVRLRGCEEIVASGPSSARGAHPYGLVRRAPQGRDWAAQ